MPKKFNLIDREFGRLTVVEEAESRHNKSRWLCKCECGGTTIAYGSCLVRGSSTSCGCKSAELTGERSLKHGHKRGRKNSRTYAAWLNMKSRCTNPKSSQWKDYGGRGITFDPRWDDFQNFLSDMGECPDGKELDRIDTNGNYFKDNCRWTTHDIQNHNRRGWGSSQYKGVSHYKATDKYSSYIRKDGRQYHLGYYETEIEAARAYDRAALEFYGESASLNILTYC